MRVNEFLTNWFFTSSGVKQGDALSPTLFAVYINDLANTIKSLGCGVQFGGENISVLLYADDIILMADSEEDLQRMLSCAEAWCSKWRMTINEKKTEIMHFRNPRSATSTFQFYFGEKKLNYTKCYKYLGLYLDEHMHFTKGTTVLSESASRALGGVIGKTKMLKDIGFSTYTKLFQACVCPVLDYVAGVWGYKNFPGSEKIQNRAIRYFMGVHKFAPIPATAGDMGWDSCRERWSVCIMRLWNRLLRMDDNRVAKKVFECDMHKIGGWASEVYELYVGLGCGNVFTDKVEINLKIGKELLALEKRETWISEVRGMPKLRTLCQIKHLFGTENYILYNLSKRKRSLCAQIRSGILPLHIESGRWVGTSEENRLCTFCELEEIENEIHFFFYCPFYHDLRLSLFKKVDVKEVHYMCDTDMLAWLFQYRTFLIADFIEKAWARRNMSLYV